MSTIEFFSAVVSQAVLFPLQLVQFVSFWASISLPFFYIPLLYSGMETGIGVFAGLLALHVVALVLGHGYGRDDPDVKPSASA